MKRKQNQFQKIEEKSILLLENERKRRKRGKTSRKEGRKLSCWAKLKGKKKKEENFHKSKEDTGA